jgi:GST-like protein
MEAVQWLFFQMAGVGPMFGQLGFFFKYAGSEWEDKRPLERYKNETRRLLGVLDRRMEGRNWIVGDEYTIADIAILGWVRNLRTGYNAADLVGLDSFKNVCSWLDRWLERPAVQKGLTIPARPEGA